MKIGFIGLGDLGLPMAERVLRAGHELHVWARRREQAAAIRAEGAEWADSPAALAEACEVVALCVRGPDDVDDVVFGEGGVASAAGGGLRLVVDHSTSHPMRTRNQADRLRDACGAGWVDAPVSGGSGGARAGTLAVMAGGRGEDVELARPELTCFAGRITHMGQVGNGQATKLANQIILAQTAAGLSEAFRISEAFGLDVSLLETALGGGLADSNLARLLLPQMTKGRVRGRVDLMLKDLEMLEDIASAVGLDPWITTRAIADYRRALEAGYNDEGLGALRKL